MSSKYSPKLSIIMQSFLKDYPGARSDPERKFIRAVYSVISQTNQNWELVIVSDGCSITEKLYNDYFREYDNILFEKVTEHAAQNMQQKDDEVEFRIPGSPRGRAVEMATGDWICYLDADDVYTRDAVDNIINFLKKLNNSGADKRFLINKSRIENFSWVIDEKSNMYEAGEPFRVPGLDSLWKTVSLINDNISSSCSMLIHKAGYPEHKWGDGGDYKVPRDTLFIRRIINDKEQIKHGMFIDIPYYIRCHTKPKDVTNDGWDY